MKRIGTDGLDEGNLYICVCGEGTGKPVSLSGSMFYEIPSSVFNVLKMGNKSKTHTSWREKREKNQEAAILKCLLPRHLDVEALIQKTPKGKLITDKQIRDKLTEDYHVDFTCAKVTGISIWIIANAAEEDLQNGKRHITPHWRVVIKDGSLKHNFLGTKRRNHSWYCVTHNQLDVRLSGFSSHV